MCEIVSCVRPQYCRSLCVVHYSRLRTKGDVLSHVPVPPPRHRRTSDTCSTPGCHRAPHARGRCKAHDHRGDDHVIKPQAPFGSGSTTIGGYRMVAAHGHPNANHRGRIMEHRLVMSRMLGRPLHGDETVHHKNGDRLDNRPDNLELWSSKHPPGQRVVDLLEWAEELIARYGR